MLPLLINRRKIEEIKQTKNLKVFINYSETINDLYETFEDYNPTKKRKMFIVFDDMITDMETNKSL